MSLLKQIEYLPEGLLQLDARQLHARLGGPTLLHLAGRREPPLFVSVLMHGNEDTGWEAMRRVLAHYLRDDGSLELPRSLSLFIGNTAAAAQGLRRLPGQPDYNRVWPGGELHAGEEVATMREVLDVMAARGLFAAIDLHNNTGINPHYGCVNVLENAALHLAAMFSRTVVFFVRPRGVASMALATLGPSVTLECGKAGQQHGTVHAAEYVDACLRLAELPQQPVPAHDIDLFHTVAVARVPPELEFGFAGDLASQARAAALEFVADLDHLNFRELPAGTCLAEVSNGQAMPLDVRDEQDRPVAEDYFVVQQGQLRTRVALMPSMLTCDSRVIRQDCLCYVMERYNWRLDEVATQGA